MYVHSMYIHVCVNNTALRFFVLIISLFKKKINLIFKKLFFYSTKKINENKKNKSQTLLNLKVLMKLINTFRGICTLKPIIREIICTTIYFTFFN
jgi:hypothetical protein